MAASRGVGAAVNAAVVQLVVQLVGASVEELGRQVAAEVAAEELGQQVAAWAVGTALELDVMRMRAESDAAAVAAQLIASALQIDEEDAHPLRTSDDGVGGDSDAIHEEVDAAASSASSQLLDRPYGAS